MWGGSGRGHHADCHHISISDANDFPRVSLPHGEEILRGPYLHARRCAYVCVCVYVWVCEGVRVCRVFVCVRARARGARVAVNCATAGSRRVVTGTPCTRLHTHTHTHKLHHSITRILTLERISPRAVFSSILCRTVRVRRKGRRSSAFLLARRQQAMPLRPSPRRRCRDVSIDTSRAPQGGRVVWPGARGLGAGAPRATTCPHDWIRGFGAAPRGNTSTHSDKHGVPGIGDSKTTGGRYCNLSKGQQSPTFLFSDITQTPSQMWQKQPKSHKPPNPFSHIFRPFLVATCLGGGSLLTRTMPHYEVSVGLAY